MFVCVCVCVCVRARACVCRYILSCLGQFTVICTVCENSCTLQALSAYSQLCCTGAWLSEGLESRTCGASMVLFTPVKTL